MERIRINIITVDIILLCFLLLKLIIFYDPFYNKFSWPAKEGGHGFMLMPVLLTIFVIWLGYELKKSTRIGEEYSEKFWNKEAEANVTRKKSLDGLDYIKFDVSYLPDKALASYEDDTIADYINQLKQMEDKPILNLTGLTNTELKLEYGAPNLPYLSLCDENYTTAVSLIMRLGERLINKGHIADGIRILEYGIILGSDVSNNYYLLADHYLAHNMQKEFDNLILHASSLNTINQKTIISRLNLMRQNVINNS